MASERIRIATSIQEFNRHMGHDPSRAPRYCFSKVRQNIAGWRALGASRTTLRSIWHGFQLRTILPGNVTPWIEVEMSNQSDPAFQKEQLKEVLGDAKKGILIQVPPSFPTIVAPVFFVYTIKDMLTMLMKARMVYNYKAGNLFLPITRISLPAFETWLHAVADDGLATLIMLYDLKSGYSQVPLAPEDMKRCCIKTIDKNGFTRYWAFTGYPFGVNQAVRIFSVEFLHPIINYLQLAFPETAQYIDDVAVDIANNQEISLPLAKERLDFVNFIWETAGIQLSDKLGDDPSQFLDYLGMEVDIREQTAHAKKDRFLALFYDLAKLLAEEKAQPRRLAQVVGKFTNMVNPIGRVWGRFLHTLISGLLMDPSGAGLSIEAKWAKDYHWTPQTLGAYFLDLCSYLMTFQPKYQIHRFTNPLYVVTDASIKQGGGFLQTRHKVFAFERISIDYQNLVPNSSLAETITLHTFLQRHETFIVDPTQEFDGVICINDNLGMIQNLHTTFAHDPGYSAHIEAVLKQAQRWPIPTHFEWQRRNTLRMRLADATSRPVPEFAIRHQCYRAMMRKCKFPQLFDPTTMIEFRWNHINAFMPLFRQEALNDTLTKPLWVFPPRQKEYIIEVQKFLFHRKCRGVLCIPRTAAALQTLHISEPPFFSIIAHSGFISQTKLNKFTFDFFHFDFRKRK